MFEAPPPPWNPAPVVHESPATRRPGRWTSRPRRSARTARSSQLTIKTRGEWQAEQLAHRGPRALCLTLSYGTSKVALCVAATSHGTPILRRVPLEPPGQGDPHRLDRDARGRHVHRRVHARRRRPALRRASSGRSISRLGRRRRPTPRRRSTPRARLLAVPDCFGAAARDPAHPCSNPALRKVVTPDAGEALLTPNAPAPRTSRGPRLPVLLRRRPRPRAGGTIALLGDSHAEHWRAAIEVVAQSKRWRGISLTRSGCPFNSARREAAHDSATATSATAGRARSGASSPSTRRSTRSSSPPARSADFTRDAGDGAREALRSLPKSVRRIYVLRATPETLRPRRPACVNRRLRAKRDDRHAPARSRARQARCPDPQLQGRRAAASRSSTSRSTCATRPSARR